MSIISDDEGNFIDLSKIKITPKGIAYYEFYIKNPKLKGEELKKQFNKYWNERDINLN